MWCVCKGWGVGYGLPQRGMQGVDQEMDAEAGSEGFRFLFGKGTGTFFDSSNRFVVVAVSSCSAGTTVAVAVAMVVTRTLQQEGQQGRPRGATQLKRSAQIWSGSERL